MQNEIKTSLKQAILKSLPVLHSLCDQYKELYLVWSKRENGGWQGAYEQRTCVFRVLWAAEKQIAEASAEFSNLFFSKYADYGGQNLVGVDGLGSQQLAHDRSHILKSALGYLVFGGQRG